MSFVRDCWKLYDGCLELLARIEGDELDDVDGPLREKCEKADRSDGIAALELDGSVRVDASSDCAAFRRSILYMKSSTLSKLISS